MNIRIPGLIGLTILTFAATGCPGPGDLDPDPCTPVEEECNNIDDDCDNVVDESESGGPLRRSCSNQCGPGQEECEAGEWRYCSAPQPTRELCDGEDNNCDGQTDEGCDCRHDERRPCGIDVGICEPGVQHCDAGEWYDCQLPYDPDELEEVCNDGLDNDCDGDTDEDCTCTPGEIQPCGTDVGECTPGEMTCTDDNRWDPDCVGSVGPETDICDGLDNDCDGEVDFAVAGDFGWSTDRNEPNNSCGDAAPLYNEAGALEVTEGGDVVSPSVGDPSDLMTYPSLYPTGDEDWYYTAAQEVTDCWNPFGHDCAFRFNVQLKLWDRELVGGAEQDPDDWRLCLTIGDCTEGNEYCTRGSDWFESSNLYQLSVIWGNNCLSTGRQDIRIRVYSPTDAGCGYYQVYAWFEFDDTLDCPE